MKVSASVALFLSFLVVAVRTYSRKSEYVALIQSALNEAKEEGGIPDGAVGKVQALEPVGSEFNCKQYSHSPARTVHQLTPYDIKIVGAMGNSVTAAFGVASTSILNAFIEYVELSWTIGGYKDLSKVTTIPNILKKYNPNLRGYSTKSKGWLQFPSRKLRNNVAVTGSIAQDMPLQARRLVDRIKAATTDTEFKKDWKLVSLWIGANNLCAHCKNPVKHSPANYINSIREALDYLQDNLPRTFVNLIQVIDVTRLAPLESLICDLVHGYACSCLGDQYLKETSDTAKEYQNAINELIDTGRYNVREDFTVVVQPFFEGIELPYKNGKPDDSYFALDCFHFNTKGHARAAIALWNNMLEPVGSKSLGWEDETIHCPTEDSPYFFTGRNSKY